LPNAIEILSGAVLTASLIFGGASVQGVAVDAIPQLLSLPLLVLVAGRPQELWPNAKLPILLLACAVSLLLLQLVPLPPGIWSRLPGRSALVEMYEANGMAAPWQPLSLTPGATGRAALSMLPGIAVFMGVLCLDWAARRRLAVLILSLGVGSVLLGIAQRMGGSAARGFFYNPNHTAALFYALLPFSAALSSLGTPFPSQGDRDRPAEARLSKGPAGRARDVRAPGGILKKLSVRGSRRRYRRVVGSRHAGAWRPLQHGDYGSLLRIFLCLISVPLLWLGVVMTESRLGLVLTIIATIAVVWILSRKAIEPAKRRKVLLWAAAFAVLIVPLLIPFGLIDTAARFQSGSLSNDLRWQIARTTWVAALHFFPFGSGIGSFERVYQTFERSHEISTELINNAHNDWLELLLEGGLPAGLIMGAWVIWLAGKTLSTASVAADDRSAQPLAIAGSVSLWLLALHSLAEYPVRTAALGTLFAFSCGLLCRPGRHAGPRLAPAFSDQSDALLGSKVDRAILSARPIHRDHSLTQEGAAKRGRTTLLPAL
jgi:hypothetical protein